MKSLFFSLFQTPEARFTAVRAADLKLTEGEEASSIARVPREERALIAVKLLALRAGAR